jgi:hypothetical protein
MNFEIATWYDTWNETGLNNLLQHKVPLNYATRYNLAFGGLLAAADGYTLDMAAPYAPQVLAQIQTQAPGARVYASIGPGGENVAETIADNQANNNRSTANIVAFLRQQGMHGISIDVESYSVLQYVPQLVTQFGPLFKQAGLGIAVSAPWPQQGPVSLYGEDAVAAFNQYVDAVELQDYSDFHGTPAHVRTWLEAGVQAGILMGGVCTENSRAQTSLDDTAAWTLFALQNQLRGMFSWRLDNDHGLDGESEDSAPTFTGAKAIYDTVQDYRNAS